MTVKWKVGLTIGVIMALALGGLAYVESQTEYRAMATGFNDMYLAAPTEQGTATPALLVDNAGVSNPFEVRVAATPVFWVDTNGDAEMNGTTPLLTIGDAGAEDTAIVYDGNAQDFHVALDDSADDLVIGLGSAVGTTGIVHLDENQDVGLGGASAGSKLDVTGNAMVDGAADEVQLLVS